MENKKNKTGYKIRLMSGCGMLSAVAFILQLFEFPLPMLIPDFVKFDFSDIPELIGAFAYGPVAGVIISLVKNLLKVVIKTHSFGVGELCNFLLGAAFSFTAGIIYKRKKNKKRAAMGGVIGAFVMAAVSYPVNLFITYPVYYNFMEEDKIIAAYKAILPFVNSIEISLLVFNVPFTLVKGLICVLLTMLIYKPLSPFLHGRNAPKG